jgi:hypothetical protein
VPLTRLRRHADWLSPFSETALGQLVRSWFDAPAVTSLTLSIPEKPADKLAELPRRHCRAPPQQAALMLVEGVERAAKTPNERTADERREAASKRAPPPKPEQPILTCVASFPPEAQPQLGAQR